MPQFYLAVDSENQTKIVGTQADARAINKDFQPIEIPADKPGLLAWVQQMLDETLNAQTSVEANIQPVSTYDPGSLDFEDITGILEDFLALGGGDSDTIREYAERIYALMSETSETKGTADPLPPTTEQISERSISFEDQWDSFALSLKFHFAALAMEEGRSILGSIAKPV